MAKIVLTTRHREIPYEELARDYSEHYSDDAQIATRVLAVAWSKRKQFREDMLGWSENVGGALSRKVPDQHPDNPRLWCVDCQLVNKEGQHSQNASAAGFVQYENAVYACTYRALPYRVVSDDDVGATELNRYVIRREKFAFEQQRIPGNDFRWVAPDDPTLNDKRIGEVPALPISFINLEYTVKAVPLELVPDVVSQANTINNANFDNSIRFGDVSLGFYAPRRVLFSGFDKKEYATPKGNVVADLIYTFGIRNAEWNYFPDPKGILRKLVRVTDATKGVFDESDLNDLFVYTELP